MLSLSLCLYYPIECQDKTKKTGLIELLTVMVSCKIKLIIPLPNPKQKDNFSHLNTNKASKIFAALINTQCN